MDRFLRYLGERVKRARQDRGLSQSDLAEILGISDAYVSKIELGKNAMTVTVLAKLSFSCFCTAITAIRLRKS